MKVAVVHYWLTSMRGGEKMLETLLELFPSADVYTHVYNKKYISPLINKHKVYTSSINRLPFASKLYKMYMPLMPRALLEFDLRDYDIVISSEAGPAKGVIVNPDAFHLCYCHSPMRYIWDLYHEYYKSASIFFRVFMKLLVPSLRVWDITSSNLVDRFVTNSAYTAKRIKRYYNRDAEIVFGPAEIEKYASVPRDVKDYYLVLGQLSENKRVDIAIDACAALGKKLIVAGGGSPGRLRKRAGGADGGVSFVGRVSDEEAARLLSQAKALLFPGIEDMGLVPVEAAAAGCPVIAYRKGGALDTVKENVTGIFFDEQSADSLSAAILRFETIGGAFSNRAAFAGHARNFSKDAFKERMLRVLAERKRG
ncbi:MAG: glycosyltransferase [Spirochaetaceae bacterium]|jgi:glycosyltransferase involved in cell wall biosynthesis|nr:glycosyltransferase [Spirochaetaceae bacterium]